mgnify:CR=1 FL=1
MRKETLVAVICAAVAVVIVAACLLVFDPFAWREPEVYAPVLAPVAQPPFAVEGFTAHAFDGIGALGDDIELVSFGRYTGAFVEDGSNDPVKDVLAILVKNTGEQWIEYTEITLPCGEETAAFECKCLPGGTYALLLEKNRMIYDATMTYANATSAPPAYLANAVTDFSADFALYPDDGVVNIKNISGGDIASDVTVNYKNEAGKYFLGGIVYRIRIEGGIPADGIVQRMEPNFTALHSVLLFMTYEK